MTDFVVARGVRIRGTTKDSVNVGKVNRNLLCNGYVLYVPNTVGVTLANRKTDSLHQRRPCPS